MTAFKSLWQIFLVTLALLQPFLTPAQQETGLSVTYTPEAALIGAEDRALIQTLALECEARVRELLPDLPGQITIEVNPVDWDLQVVGGVSGRSDAHQPEGRILVWISTRYPGGLRAAIADGLPSTLYHEFHHLARGWTMEGNRFGPGIPIASVNEGLAVVFAEDLTGFAAEGNGYPPEVSRWVEEILALPLNAEYNKWVSGVHPDGRAAIGYRCGNYIIRQALEKSGKDILYLSSLAPSQILELAGYSWHQDGR